MRPLFENGGVKISDLIQTNGLDCIVIDSNTERILYQIRYKVKSKRICPTRRRKVFRQLAFFRGRRFRRWRRSSLSIVSAAACQPTATKRGIRMRAESKTPRALVAVEARHLVRAQARRLRLQHKSESRRARVVSAVAIGLLIVVEFFAAHTAPNNAARRAQIALAGSGINRFFPRRAVAGAVANDEKPRLRAEARRRPTRRFAQGGDGLRIDVARFVEGAGTPPIRSNGAIGALTRAGFFIFCDGPFWPRENRPAPPVTRRPSRASAKRFAGLCRRARTDSPK